MANKQEISVPVYRQIAIDIAKNITIGKYIKGQKLFGRSVLASQYGVSPETIRKAVHLLKDAGILETERGSGIEVLSVEKATEFIERYNEVETVASLKNDIAQWMQEQTEQTAKIIRKVQHIVNTAEKFTNVSPLNPYQVRITANCKVIGKTVGEIQFWHNTGGTVIAIRRGETLILSPGPYATFCEDDMFFIVGDEAVYSDIAKFLFN